MKFSVIYSIDVPKDESIKRFQPVNLKLWDKTEGDEQYEYSYLEGIWSKGKHRKYCAVLTEKQFDSFVNDLGLIAEDVETMGSIGAPGLGYGISPAISFNGPEGNYAIINAYVTPIPEVFNKTEYNDKDWDRVKRLMIAKYGY